MPSSHFPGCDREHLCHSRNGHSPHSRKACYLHHKLSLWTSRTAFNRNLFISRYTYSVFIDRRHELNYRQMPRNLCVCRFSDDAKFCIGFYDVFLFSGNSEVLIFLGYSTVYGSLGESFIICTAV